MPPPRRRSGNSSTAGHQQTLSFGPKSRVSKPTSVPASLKNAKNTSSPSPPARSRLIAVEISNKAHRSSKSASPEAPDVVDPVVDPQPIAASSKSENVVREQAREQVQLPRSAEDRRAEELTDRDIRRYWHAEEAKRIAPRVHQEGLSVNEKILRHFDLSNQYGPCIGIARIKRWRRAHRLDLHPPIEVLAVLLKEEAQGVAREKAYIDELLS
ncbi:conserved hypothetical protein [Uncinocarpus reesii 1704]|uniref:DNA polymerase delta subunit 4 n=1 Tax=Uncinocarpus reesii (strain UAMH 1704) TaxID=336963 RepID=C4JPZ2_UNCRE|nr:uncharacterized protein UREG_04635 [Uncinocarpus reesii 1704]EEP79789.1 conserved hypothetical protein [Uncinocarpus reesii 1704]